MDYLTWVNSHLKGSSRHMRITDRISEGQKDIENYRKQPKSSVWQHMIDLETNSLQKYQSALSACEQNPVVHWLTLPKDKWDNELSYRIMDNPCHPSLDEIGGQDLNPLFRVLESLFENCNIRTILKMVSYRWVCTMSYRGEISVTRTAFDPGDCIKRTALTLLDLSWERLCDAN